MKNNKIFQFIIVILLSCILFISGYFTLKLNSIFIPLILLLISLLPLSTSLLLRVNIKQQIPDFIFGAIDTGLLTIPALIGGSIFGVIGAIVGGVIGDAVTDSIAGFFEGSIAEWLREKGIEESREALTSSLGKMTGCLAGSGLVLLIAVLFGVDIKHIFVSS